ncbi:MAG TPA: LysR substrate-binding domain-containing protein [Polyangiaceae bacterium]|nr:LysR substrate-binding domain-containing protein [Polyangiaceae bacterium]
MDHRLLTSFVVLAEELHFGRAARRLHLSQPPLSLRIQKLEQDLGVPLFVRTNRHVALTEAGGVLLARARHLLGEHDRARAEVRRVGHGEAGVLSVGYTQTATYEVLPAVVPEFMRSYPQVRLELRELTSPAQAAALREGRIELGIACLPVDAEHLVEHTLARERPVVVVPRAHRFARRKSVPAELLRGEPFVLVDREVEPGWAYGCDAALKNAGIDVKIVQETDTKIALLGLIAAGIGLSVASASIGALGRRGVVLRPLTGLRFQFRLGVLTTAEPSARAEHFLALLRSKTYGPRQTKRGERP